MKKAVLGLILFFLLSTFHVPGPVALPAQDVQVIMDAQYFQVAKKLIQESKTSIHVMMFDMRYYEEHPNSPSNLLIKALMDAKKRGVRAEVILEAREDEDRTTQGNRRTGKLLSAGGVEVLYDPLFKTTHAKCMVVDGEIALLGSTNWTYHALTNNNELSLLIRSREVANELINYFNRVKATGGK